MGIARCVVVVVVVDGPLELSKNDIFFIKNRKSTSSHFRTEFLVKNNPRRVRRRLAQRLYPVQKAKST